MPMWQAGGHCQQCTDSATVFSSTDLQAKTSNQGEGSLRKGSVVLNFFYKFEVNTQSTTILTLFIWKETWRAL
jgi:hypothetical protein